MAFPTINIKGTNANIPDSLRDFVEEKVTSLEKFLKNAQDIKCDVELEKTTDQNTGDIYRAEINLFAHGTLYRAEATRDTFENAIDEMRNEVKKELRRAGDKRDSLIRRGGRRIKEMLRGS